MDKKTFRQFLIALRDEAGARLCGSCARGDYDMKPGFLSDIDFVIPAVSATDGWGDPIEDRPMTKAIAVFERFGVPIESILPGQVSSPRDLTTLLRPVEVMEHSWVDADPKLPERVEFYGITFLTHNADAWADAVVERFAS